MKNVVGIDLGTTYSAISRLNSIGKPEVVPLEDAQRVIASSIYFADNDKTLVGDVARNMSEIDNTRYADTVKRYMGNEYYPTLILNRKWTPVELSGIILAKIKHDFEQSYGSIDECVITVPAYFDEIRRRATMDAAKMAGINAPSIVNEPSAAGLFYATQFDINGKTIVFDLGGGTFDVTLLNVTNKNGKKDVEIICSNGDSALGGKDFDKEIMKDINNQYKEKYGVFYTSKKEHENHLMKVAETIKKDLSKLSSAKQIIQGEKGPLVYDLTRDKFEEMISSYFAKIEMLIESVMDESKMQTKEVDQILLVGGSSRIPLVERTIETLFNKKPLKMGNMDESVSLGAAIFSGLKAMNNSTSTKLSPEMKKNLNDISLVDVCNHSYGTFIAKYDEKLEKMIVVNDILIPKNTKLPHSVMKTFYTMVDGQTSIDISITQGESENAKDVNVLRNLEMDIPGGRERNQPVEVTYSYDINQMMHCVFHDVNSGRKQEVTIGRDELSDDDTLDDFKAYLDF